MNQKEAGGVRKRETLREHIPGSKRAPPEQLPEDSRLQKARAVGLKKAKEAQKTKCLKAKVEKGAGQLAGRVADMDKAYVLEWLDQRRCFYGYLAGLMRGGLLEADYKAHMDRINGTGNQVHYGVPCFSDGAQRWKALKTQPAIQLLARLLPNPQHVLSWFRGEDRLPGDVAVKAVLFLLGVTEQTRVPHGHAQECISQGARPVW